jgi:hypothetical protein
MNPLTLGNITITLKGLLLVGVTVQWLLLLVAVIFTRVKAQIRGTEIALLFSTIAFGATWYVQITKAASLATVQASALSETPSRSCSGVKPGAKSADVENGVGKPDHIIGEEEVRGPAAEVWVYEDIRCAVHMLGDTVESVE